MQKHKSTAREKSFFNSVLIEFEFPQSFRIWWKFLQNRSTIKFKSQLKKVTGNNRINC